MLLVFAEIVEDLQEIYDKHKQSVNDQNKAKSDPKEIAEDDLGNAGYDDDFEEDSEAEVSLWQKKQCSMCEFNILIHLD